MTREERRKKAIEVRKTLYICWNQYAKIFGLNMRTDFYHKINGVYKELGIIMR